MRYDVYKLNPLEIIVSVLIWVSVSAFLAFFFYRSVIAAIIIFLFVPIFIKYVKKYLKERRNRKLEAEFKEMIRILSINLQSGNSAENAFVNTLFEMKKLYGEKAMMTKECEVIVRGLENNVVIEDLILSLGERSANEEIADFAGIFAIAKRSGGNLKEIISDTVEVIESKIEMKREFMILISSKQFEHRIMCIIPFAIVSYIGISSPGYFDGLYGNPFGIGIMSVCLAVYLGAFIWGEKIADIKF
ncbi:MAG: type II secretion system F family protein [Lachnospiraceae bacterium]|nr:type II secretion system F family protein [Lachnospiraceae bacterium]